jgi:PhnB protein
MQVQPIPPGFHTITPYLMAKDATRLIDFLKTALDAEVKHLSKAPDGLLLHATLQIGNSMLMLTDARPQWPAQPTGIYLYVPDVDESYQRAIKAGAESINEPRNEFYGDRMGGVKDPSGNSWWIATHIEDVSEGEMQQRREKLFSQKAKSA